MESKINKDIKTKWPNKRPLVAKMNIPIVKVVYLDARSNGNKYILYNIFDLYGKNIHSSFGDIGIELFSKSAFKFKNKFSIFDFKTEIYKEEDILDCFSFKALKKQKKIAESQYGKIGWCTNLNAAALNNMREFIKVRNGSKTMYPVLLYGYIPEGSLYYRIAPYNNYYNENIRYMSEHIYLLPLTEQTMITDLTGYYDFLKFVN